VTVRFMSVARQRAGVATVEYSSNSCGLGEVLKEIADRYKLADIIFDDEWEIRRWARVLVNGRSHQFVGGLNRELCDGDRLAVIYPYTENL
jgi:molybdopterin converting factor small subunit